MSQTIRNSTKTFRPTKIGFHREWYLLDASKLPLGRLASEVAKLLIGKNRADYSSDVDMGAMVVVINSKKIVLTGKKAIKKNYFWHEDSRIGALKTRSFAEQMTRDSSRPIYLAVKGMLPKNRHRDLRLNNRLFIFEKNHNLPNKMTEVDLEIVSKLDTSKED